MLLDNVSIGPGSLIQSAILDEGTNVGGFCRIGSNEGNITLLEQKAVIPDYTYLGYSSQKLVEVTVDQFADIFERV
jgi:hypothetical protein